MILKMMHVFFCRFDCLSTSRLGLSSVVYAKFNMLRYANAQRCSVFIIGGYVWTDMRIVKSIICYGIKNIYFDTISIFVDCLLKI